PSRRWRARDSHTGAHSDPEAQKRWSAPAARKAETTASPPSRPPGVLSVWAPSVLSPSAVPLAAVPPSVWAPSVWALSVVFRIRNASSALDRPVQDLGDTAAHDPFQFLGSEVPVLGELLDGVGVGDAVPEETGDVGAVEAALRSHAVDHLAHILLDVAV